MASRFRTGLLPAGNRYSYGRQTLPLLILAAYLPVFAQQAPSITPPVPGGEAQPEAAASQIPTPGDVIIDGEQILRVYQPVASMTPEQRAEKIAERIIAVARDAKIPAESVAMVTRDAWTEIVVGDRLLMGVTDIDAKLAGTTRKQLAYDDVASIRQAILNYRNDHNWKAFFRGLLYALLTTAALLPIGWIIRKLRITLRRRLENWIKARADVKEKKTALQITFIYLASTILAVGSVIRWLMLITVFEIYTTIVLSFFPATRSISHAITGWIFSALGSFGRSLVGYLPNLAVIAVIAVVAAQMSRMISVIFAEIGKGNLSIRGFYPEWAGSTAKLIRMLVLVLVLVVIFPYLPGSKSPAFRGISIFVGVLLSLGSSSAVANAIAGIILTYMRSFSVGDWVKIGDTVGEVEEKNMLVTRILTPKQETITIPNGAVMNGSVMNYTREAKNAGVIFHTTVTIGYDAPWKTVHKLLIDAALATEHIRRDPQPFVLQTQLNDFYVSYELNAYTDVPRNMQYIYSHLHENIQDRFNEAGVEICSPHFASLRDGNTIAIPARYVSRDYTAPSFRIEGLEKEANQTLANRR